MDRKKITVIKQTSKNTKSNKEISKREWVHSFVNSKLCFCLCDSPPPPLPKEEFASCRTCMICITSCMNRTCMVLHRSHLNWILCREFVTQFYNFYIFTLRCLWSYHSDVFMQCVFEVCFLFACLFVFSIFSPPPPHATPSPPPPKSLSLSLFLSVSRSVSDLFVDMINKYLQKCVTIWHKNQSCK